MLGLIEGISALRKWVKDTQVSDLGELDHSLEDEKTCIFGHQFIIDNDSKSLFAVAADGSMHVQVLDGYLEHTKGKVQSVQVEQSLYVLWNGGLIKMTDILGPGEL